MLSIPESTSAASARRAFNKLVVDKKNSVLKDIQRKQNITPHRMFNIDETSLCTLVTKTQKCWLKLVVNEWQICITICTQMCQSCDNYLVLNYIVNYSKIFQIKLLKKYVYKHYFNMK